MKTNTFITFILLIFSLQLNGQIRSGRSEAQESADNARVHSMDMTGTEDGFLITLLITGSALLIPSYCINMKYLDDNGREINKESLGCGVDIEGYGGKYIAIGGSLKYNSSKYLGFAPKIGGYLSGKLDLGLGIPTNSDIFGGLYVGGSFGAGWVGISESQGALSHGLWSYLGNDNLGIKFSYDIFPYKDVTGNIFDGLIKRYLYSTQLKLYLGHYFTVGYSKLNSTIDGVNEQISFITLGICFKAGK
jgi:hypothetical protein